MPGLLTTIWQKRSLENPSTPLSAPDDWLFDSLGSFRASSGVNVNRETALTYDAFWRCVALLSGDTAKLPLCVKKVTPSGKLHDYQHDAYRLLRWKSSAELMALHVKRVLTFHAIAEGNGYGYIFRDRDARPLEILPLSPMKTYPVREDGRLLYVTEVGRSPRKLLPENVLHIKGLSFDGMVGYSAVAKMRETLGLGLAAQNFGSIFFRNNARPNVVLKHPGRLKPEAKINLRESWERMHSGLENAHRTAILEEGMDIVALMHNARDSQLLELKGFSRVEICNFFGVPPHKVGDNSRTSYNSLEQENEAYIEDGHGLGYWLAAWEAECWDKLLTEDEKDKLTHVVEFDRSGLLRANLQTRTQAHATAIQWGWMCPDEVRGEEGLNPRPDGLGDKFLQPLNMQVAGEPPPPDPAGSGNPKNQDPNSNGKPPKPGKKKQRLLPPPAVVKAHHELVVDVAQRIGRRIATHARRAASDPKKFMAWVDSFAGEHRAVAVEALKPVLAAIAAAGQDPGGPDTTADALLAEYRDELMVAAGAFTAAQLPQQIERLVHLWVTTKPAALADKLLARAKPGKPTRTTEQALELLDKLPQSDGGDADGDGDQVQIPMAVDEDAPYDVGPGDLKGQVEKKTVKLRTLVATRGLVKRERVRLFLKNPDAYRESGKNVQGLPTDRPYVVRCGGVDYIYDGHHRLMGMDLLGVARVKVYLFKEDEA